MKKNITKKHNYSIKNSLIKGALFVLVVVSLASVAFFQQNIQSVTADVKPLLVKIGQISFGNVFPGETFSKFYTVLMTDDSDGEIPYKIETHPKARPEFVSEVGDSEAREYCAENQTDHDKCYHNLCFLIENQINDINEEDVAESAFLSPEDTEDEWRVTLATPAIKGFVAQDHQGGIVDYSGEYGCDLSVNYLYENSSSICGYKFFDENKNSIFDDAETGLSDWEIELYQKTECQADDSWASEVVSFARGLRKDGQDIVASRTNPENALGVAQNNDQINFVSLGYGGELVLKFNKHIYNGEGEDLRVYETSFNNPSCVQYPESVRVFASLTGNEDDWHDLGSGCLDSSFDLGSLDKASYIKLVDLSVPDQFSQTTDGYDVDGVQSLHCAPEWNLVSTKTTDENGSYCFENLESSQYLVQEIMQEGWQNVTPISQTVQLQDEEDININFGNYQTSTQPDICSINSEDWTTIDSLSVGSTTLESYYNLSGWSQANIEGQYGGCQQGENCSYRQIWDNPCDQEQRSAELVMHAGENTVEQLKIKHLDGISLLDSFDIYINEIKVGSFIDETQFVSEVWKETVFDISDYGFTGNITVKLEATDNVWNMCPQYGQVSVAEISLIGCGETWQVPQPEDPFCGNGILEDGEECDGSAGTPEGYVCSNTCTLDEEGGSSGGGSSGGGGSGGGGSSGSGTSKADLSFNYAQTKFLDNQNQPTYVESVIVKNSGQTKLSSGVLTLDIPENIIEFISAYPEWNSYATNTQTASWNINDMEVAEEYEVFFEVKPLNIGNPQTQIAVVFNELNLNDSFYEDVIQETEGSGGEPVDEINNPQTQTSTGDVAGDEVYEYISENETLPEVAGKAEEKEQTKSEEWCQEEGSCSACILCKIWVWILALLLHLVALAVFYKFVSEEYYDKQFKKVNGKLLEIKNTQGVLVKGSWNWWPINLTIYIVVWLLLVLICSLTWWLVALVLLFNFLSFVLFYYLIRNKKSDAYQWILGAVYLISPVLVYIWCPWKSVWVWLGIISLYVLGLVHIRLTLVSAQEKNKYYGWIFTSTWFTLMIILLEWILRQCQCW